VVVSTSAPTVDLLRWIDARPRRYDDTIEAWKTSCPQLSIWDDAVIEGLVRVDRSAEQDPIVVLTPLGREALGRRAQLRLEDDRDRTVVDERELHASAEHARLHLDA
jgi:hypothetical protein